MEENKILAGNKTAFLMGVQRRKNKKTLHVLEHRYAIENIHIVGVN